MNEREKIESLIFKVTDEQIKSIRNRDIQPEWNQGIRNILWEYLRIDEDANAVSTATDFYFDKEYYINSLLIHVIDELSKTEEPLKTLSEFCSRIESILRSEGIEK